MNRHVLGLVVLMAACGSEPAIVTPPPPPPGGTTPASLTVQVGDNQTANPGAAVTVKLIVAVKDAAGLGVAGVTVTFSVDSGGGSIQSTTATTATDGTASPGDWQLGSAEGRNVVTARTGSLTPLKVVATAQVATVTVAGQSVSTSGGTVTLNQPGSAFNGTTLTFPAGALSAGATIGFSISSANAVPAPAGMTAVTPGLTITGPAGALKQPATLRIPVATPAGKIIVVVAFDPTTGVRSLVPSAAHDASSITVGIGSIDASSFASAPGASLRAGGPIVITYAVDPALLAPDFDSGFRPGADDWDFQRQAISAFPESDAVPIIDPATPMVATSLWYFVKQKNLGGKLWQKYQEAVGVPESNRRGLRWQSVAYPNFPDLFAPGALADKTRAAHVADPAALANQEFLELKAAFLLSSNKPQPIFLFTASNAVVDTEPRYGIAYRTVGSSVDLSIPDAPGATFRIMLSPTGWTPATVTTRSRVQYTVDFIAPIQYGIFVQDPTLAPQFALVAAGTIGDALGWPSTTFQSIWGKLDPTGFFVTADAADFWWECAACIDHGYRTTLLTPSPTQLVLSKSANQAANGTWPNDPFDPSGLFNNPRPRETLTENNLPIDPATQSRVRGYAIYQAVRRGNIPAGGGFLTPWLDWVVATGKKLPATITPVALEGSVDIATPMKMQITGTTPSPVKYVWDFGENTGTVTVAANPNTQHVYTATGNYPVTVKMLDANTNQPLSKATGTAVITPLHFAWKFVSATAPSFSPPPGGVTSSDQDVTLLGFFNSSLSSLQTTPDKSLIFVSSGVGNCLYAFLEQFPSTPINVTMPVAEAFRAAFGSNCVDPDYIWSLTMGTLGGGTLVGNVVPSDVNPNIIVVPGGSINATMNGATLQGTFVWRVRFDNGIGSYTVNFVATQVAPTP